MSADACSRERVRAITALIDIRGSRTKGEAVSDDEVAHRHGYRDAAELVSVMVEEMMPVPKAVWLMTAFLAGPWPEPEGILPLSFRIEAELKKAIDAGEPWIKAKRALDGPIEKLLDEYIVEPRAMLEWFLASRMRRDFVAAPLRNALTESAAPVIEEQRAITGPKPGMHGSQARAYAEAQAILAAGEAPRTKRALAQMVMDRLGIPHKRDSVERWLSDLRLPRFHSKVGGERKFPRK